MKNITIAYGDKYIDLCHNWGTHVRAVNNIPIYVHTDPHNEDVYKTLGYEVLQMPKDAISKFKIKEKLQCFLWRLIMGDDFLYSDIDAVWLTDMCPIMEDMLSDCDMVFSMTAHGNSYPRNVASKLGFAVCTGFFAAKTSNKTIDFFRDCLEYEHSNDQCTVNDMIFTDNEYELTGSITTGYAVYLPKLDIRIKILDRDIVLRARGNRAKSTLVHHPISTTSNPQATTECLKMAGLWKL